MQVIPSTSKLSGGFVISQRMISSFAYCIKGFLHAYKCSVNKSKIILIVKYFFDPMTEKWPNNFGINYVKKQLYNLEAFTP